MNRVRIFRCRSLRGLLAVIPTQDLWFYGLTFRWIGVGIVVTRKRESSS